MNAKLKNENIDQIYLPFNLSRLLEHMTLKQRRETVHSRIDQYCYDPDKTVETVRNFIKLFIIDHGAMDTLSRDEWSRKIANAIHWQNIKAKLMKGEKVDI
jgi:hypothetical protein